MNPSIYRIIYDPLRARILYDVAAAWGSYFSVILLFLISGMRAPNLSGVVMFSLVFILSCAILGLYNKLRLAWVVTKVVAISCGCLMTMLILTILGYSNYFLVFSLFIAWITTVFPRLAFAFTANSGGQPFYGVIEEGHFPILVVGGGGYIGCHVVEELLKQGFTVRVLDTFRYGKDVLSDLARHPHLELIEGDVTDIYKLTLAMQKASAVVHLAGIVGDPACAVDPDLTRHVNIISTRILKESAKASGVKRFIFASSCSVYGASTTHVNENSKLNPVSLYAQTKIDSEREILRDTHDNFYPVILRFATVFGHSRKPRFDLVANLFVAQAYHEGTIILTGGSQWRPFIHVHDVARAIALVLKAPDSKVSRQIFNVGDGKLNLTISQLADVAKSVVSFSRHGKSVFVIEQPDASDQRNYFVSFEKIKKELGFKAKIGIEQGMQEIYLNWKNKVYKGTYKDPDYSNLESAKALKQQFHQDAYQQTHISIMGEVRQMDKLRKNLG